MRKANKFTIWFITFLCEKGAIKAFNTEECLGLYEQGEEAFLNAFTNEFEKKRFLIGDECEEWLSEEGVHLGTLIEFIGMGVPPSAIDRRIQNTFIAIDYKNGNIYHFLEHLAKGYMLQVRKWAQESDDNVIIV